MNLSASLRAEFLKTKRSSLWYLCFLTAALIPFVMFFDYASAEGLDELKKDPWNIYFVEGGKALNIMFLPLYITMICTLLPQIEYKNNTWKQVLASPQSAEQLFLSKYLIVHLFILLFYVAYVVFMAVSLLAKNMQTPALNLFSHSPDGYQLLTSAATTYVSVLAISAVQFWIGLRSRNFIAPIGLGLVLWFSACLLAIEYKWEYAKQFPFAIPIYVAFPKYASLIPFLLQCSIAYTLCFLSLAFIDFKLRKRIG